MTSTATLADRQLARDPDLLRATAQANGVCIRPILQELVDTVTGTTQTVAIRCGSTRASKCPPCADKARRLRMQQCREGWHRTDEPERNPDEHEDEVQDGEDQADEDDASPRRVRSTRRRQDAPDLPKVEMTDRTIGKQLTSPSGRTYRPSMFLTLTLPSYGRVHGDGTPVDPASYDYRRAALDALHFSRLVDRFWQNLRRCAGYRVQYFSAVEEQRRLAPHLHAAVRGVIPRTVVLQVVAATYHQVWWPAFDELVYTDRLPTWDERRGGYVCPYSGGLLPTWGQALDELDQLLNADPATPPAHVARFGEQADYKWLIADSARTDKIIGYVTKYLTKSISDTYDSDTIGARQADHVARLMAEVRWLPCSPECANWLRHGIQPSEATDGMLPGACGKSAHDPENLGYGGRRVLVSRDWTSKTLTEHRADRAAVVREVLAQAGIEVEDTDRCSATVLDETGRPRFLWEPVDPTRAASGLWRSAVLNSLREANARRRQYQEAKRAGPTDAVRQPLSCGLPTASQHQVSGLAVKGERSESRSDRRPLTGRSETEPSTGGRPHAPAKELGRK